MLAVNHKEYEKYGCPNCGCDRAIQDSCFRGDQPSATCKECGIRFQIFADGIMESSVGFGTGRTDGEGKDIVEYPRLIPHPRKGIPKWNYELPDIRPDCGEYWNPRGVGYDLSGFVKSKQAGERLLAMVKEVLNNDTPLTWLDYREHEPEWIQLKFQKEEFNLDRLCEAVSDNGKILTKEILIRCKL